LRENNIQDTRPDIYPLKKKIPVEEATFKKFSSDTCSICTDKKRRGTKPGQIKYIMREKRCGNK
jgi:hypothetical protein